MKILIAFFSGTGNTRYCAEYLENRLRGTGAETSVRSIENLPKEEIKDFDFLVIGFPVYACDMPNIMRDYLCDIPAAAGKKAYIFCTKALSSGNALKKAADILSAAGYSVSGTADVKMPGSDGLIFLGKDSLTAKKLAEKDFGDIKPLDLMAERIGFDMKTPDISMNKGSGRQLRTKLSGTLADGLFKATYDSIVRLMRGKFYADENCIRCGLCVKICPSHNIIMTQNGIFFSNRCFLCMRCVNQCPKEAIQIGKGTVGKMRWKGPDNDFNPLKQDGQ